MINSYENSVTSASGARWSQRRIDPSKCAYLGSIIAAVASNLKQIAQLEESWKFDVAEAHARELDVE